MSGWVVCGAELEHDDRLCILEFGHRHAHAVKPTYRELIRIEAAHPQPGPGRDHAIDATNLPRTRYYQYLNAMLQDPAALAIDALTVNRLIRIRNEVRDNRLRRMNIRRTR